MLLTSNAPREPQEFMGVKQPASASVHSVMEASVTAPTYIAPPSGTSNAYISWTLPEDVEIVMDDTTKEIGVQYKGADIGGETVRSVQAPFALPKPSRYTRVVEVQAPAPEDARCGGGSGNVAMTVKRGNPQEWLPSDVALNGVLQGAFFFGAWKRLAPEVSSPKGMPGQKQWQQQ